MRENMPTASKTSQALTDTQESSVRKAVLNRLSGDIADELNINKDIMLSDHPNDIDYNYLQVEPLLNQAAALLERAVSDRDKWFTNRVEEFKLRLEFLEFERTKCDTQPRNRGWLLFLPKRQG
jgi:hypothetical protein